MMIGIYRKEETEHSYVPNRHMDKRIRRIYRSIIQDTNYMDDARQEIQKEVEKILEEERKQMDWRDYEKYRDKVFSAVAVAEERGFIKGFKYAVMLLAECFQHEESTTAEP